MESDWRFCACMGGKRAPTILGGVFSVARATGFDQQKEVSGQAGEMLAILPPLRYMLEITLPRDILTAEIASFCALCKCVGLLQLAKTRDDVSDDLATASYDHSVKKTVAYGAEFEDRLHVPKDHAAKHVPAQIKRDVFF